MVPGNWWQKPSSLKILEVIVHTYIHSKFRVRLSVRIHLKQQSWQSWSCSKGIMEMKWDLSPCDCQHFQHGRLTSLLPSVPHLISWLSHFPLCHSFFHLSTLKKKKDHKSKWITLFTNFGITFCISGSFCQYLSSISICKALGSVSKVTEMRPRTSKSFAREGLFQT